MVVNGGRPESMGCDAGLALRGLTQDSSGREGLLRDGDGMEKSTNAES